MRQNPSNSTQGIRNGEFRARLTRLVICAIFTALSIVFGKYLSISTELFRISFENLTILMAGVFFSPFYGAAVGICADLIGCLMVGYSINPIITFGAASVGFASGICFKLLSRLGLKGAKRLYPAVMSGHILGSMMIKSIGLWVYYRQPFAILIWRVPLYIVIGAAEFYIIYLLMKNRSFMKVLTNYT